jgi:hypothetical protein
MLELWKKNPSHLKERAIESAIEKFIEETNLDVDKTGFFNQTLEKFAKGLLFSDPTIDIWLSDKDGEIDGYVVVHLAKDIDNSLCYWISQAWASKDMRANGFTKECWVRLKKRANELQCKHVVLVSSRNNDAFNRFLGGKFKEYATILTMDLN